MTARANDPHIGLVVEGQGEVEAVPVLFRRWLAESAYYQDILGKPVPCHGRDKALRAGELEGKVATAAARPGCRAVLIILDGEGDPVCDLGPELLARAHAVTGTPVGVCLADNKYEAWLAASASTLGLPHLIVRPGRDAGTAIKEALWAQGSKYVKTVWQPRLTARMDLQLARRWNGSLARTFERFDGLVRTNLLP